MKTMKKISSWYIALSFTAIGVLIGMLTDYTLLSSIIGIFIGCLFGAFNEFNKIIEEDNIINRRNN